MHRNLDTLKKFLWLQRFLLLDFELFIGGLRVTKRIALMMDLLILEVIKICLVQLRLEPI